MSTRDFFFGPPTLQGTTAWVLPAWPRPYRLLAITTIFTTEANASVRHPMLQMRESASSSVIGMWSGHSTNNPGASQQYQVTFSPSPAFCSTLPTASTGSINIPIPDDLIIWPSMTMRLFINNGQGNDFLSASVAVIDQEPWRPGFYHPDLPRARRKPRVPIRTVVPDDQDGFPG